MNFLQRIAQRCRHAWKPKAQETELNPLSPFSDLGNDILGQTDFTKWICEKCGKIKWRKS